ncbi:MAG: hypothetical protein OXH06_11560 [Gemmatimonadetes bacterium]|nr:hypothetical protein [Gemmatimonadota bacterium]
MNVRAGAEFSHTASVAGGCGFRTSSREAGPEWVERRVVGGGELTIHGTEPSTPVAHDVTMRVRDAYSNAGEASFRIEVVPPPRPPLRRGDPVAARIEF